MSGQLRVGLMMVLLAMSLLAGCGDEPGGLAELPDPTATQRAASPAPVATATRVPPTPPARATEPPPSATPLLDEPIEPAATAPAATEPPTRAAATSGPPSATASRPSATAIPPSATALAVPPLAFIPGVFPLPICDRLFGGGVLAPVVGSITPEGVLLFQDRVLLQAAVWFPHSCEEEVSVIQPDGTNIRSVSWTITGPDGIPHYIHTENAWPYCLFGGSTTTCDPLWDFTANNCEWPDGVTFEPSGVVAVEGAHSLQIDLLSSSGEAETWFSPVFFLDFSDGHPCSP